MADRRRITVPRAVEQALDAALDRALAVQRPVVLAHLDRVRRKNPASTPAELVERLERQYLVAVTGLGGASGAAAALPGAGTAATVASGAAEIAAFVSASAMFVLALAELHEIPVSDPQVRRALVLSVLVGEGALVALEDAAGGQFGKDVRWAQVLGKRAAPDKERITSLNGYLGRLLLRRMGTRQGALLVGRALPLGIGAAIGAGGNAALGRAAIRSARAVFGPPPSSFPPRVVDA